MIILIFISLDETFLFEFFLELQNAWENVYRATFNFFCYSISLKSILHPPRTYAINFIVAGHTFIVSTACVVVYSILYTFYFHYIFFIQFVCLLNYEYASQVEKERYEMSTQHTAHSTQATQS